MKMSTNIKNYLRNLRLEQLFERLGASNPQLLAKEVEHFTAREAERRDRIVIGYFGEKGVDQIVDTIARILLTSPRLPANATILDLGAGSGFFTVKIADKIHANLSKASFCAMDLTPAMLLSLAKKKAHIQPFIGMAENIEDSIEEARRHFNIPYKFDAIFSTLMLHHSLEPEKVFGSIKKVLRENGKAIIIDLCEHSFEEFQTEMGDVHLGFKPENIRRMAKKYFSEVKVEKLPGISCECSGRSAKIFAVSMQNHT